MGIQGVEGCIRWETGINAVEGMGEGEMVICPVDVVFPREEPAVVMGVRAASSATSSTGGSGQEWPGVGSLWTEADCVAHLPPLH